MYFFETLFLTLQKTHLKQKKDTSSHILNSIKCSFSEIPLLFSVELSESLYLDKSPQINVSVSYIFIT